MMELLRIFAELGRRQEQQHGEPQIIRGMVGWEGVDKHFDLGTDENDGHTLIRVQLFSGRDIASKPLDPTRAQGHKILCHLSSGLYRIPKPGTLVWVAVEPGQENVPGAGVIFASVEKSPSTQFDHDRAVMDFGDDTHVVIKGKSISLQDPDNRFLTVGSPRSGGKAGLTFQAKDGTGGVIQEGVVGWFVSQDRDAKTIIQMTPDKIEIIKKDGGYCKLDNDGVYNLGKNFWGLGGAVYLGRAPLAANPALWGLTGIAGVASTSVFLSI